MSISTKTARVIWLFESKNEQYIDKHQLSISISLVCKYLADRSLIAFALVV